MRILILGASGYVGRCIRQVLKEHYTEVFGTYQTENEQYTQDLSMYRYCLEDTSALDEILRRTRPEMVISCLRGDFHTQLKVHKRLAAYLSEKETGRIIYLSSANAFDHITEMNRPHPETDIPKADSEYRNFKIKCEKLLLSMLKDRAVIIRIPEVWGHDCPRLKTLLQAVKNKEEILTYEKYVVFQQTLLTALKKEGPVFKKEVLSEKLFQAVLPGRGEIPDSMQICVEDVIRYLTGDLY